MTAVFNSTTWSVLTAALVIIELFTGSLYCVAIAAGTGVGASIAWAGGSEITQICVAAGVSLIATAVVARFQRARKATAPKDSNADIGQVVTVSVWKPDGTARVRYRGAEWDARLTEGATSDQQTYKIVGQNGNILLIN